MVLTRFPAKELFERVEFRYSNADPHYGLVGPSAAAVGWIPYYSDPAQLPPGALQDRWKSDPSLAKVFETGNRQPPEQYSGPLDLIRDLEQNDFRSAICLDAPTVFFSRQGEPVLVQFLAMARIGYTAVRWGWAKVIKHSDGSGNACGHVLDGGIHLRLFVRFKLGTIGQLVARKSTGHWPPNATSVIDYVMNPGTVRAEISFSGTIVPQMTSYVGWKAVHQYTIGDLSNPAYDSFVQSAGCQDALNRVGHREVADLLGPVFLKE